MSVVRSDVIRSLESMGLKAGDRVMVHSSLSSMGHVEGGAPTVLQAFLDVLGAAGTLMVPTFTHSGCQYYDPLLTPSLNGAITEAARSLPGAIRSLHPTHAVTVVGPDAEDLVEDDLDRGALGRDSALDRLIKKGGMSFFSAWITERTRPSTLARTMPEMIVRRRSHRTTRRSWCSTIRNGVRKRSL